MMRKFTTYLFISSIWFCLSSCDGDEVTAPPATSFTVDKTSTLTGDDVTFVIDEVDADAISLLPYGQAESGRSGVLVPKSSFTSGKATVVFSYGQVGTFNPVVVTSNYTEDGESIERTYSETATITVASDDKSITAFTFDGSTKTTIDQGAKTIVVEQPYADEDGVPYGKNLAANFSASSFSTVTVGATTQVSETTTNDFTNPVVYTVTANDGSSSDYTVTLDQELIETDNTIKSMTGTPLSKSAEDKSFPAFVDNTNDFVVIYAPNGTTAEAFDSVRVAYELNGGHAVVEYGGAGEILEQDSLLNMTTSKQVTVKAQDASTATYTIYADVAPKLELAFNGLIPTVTGSTSDFDIELKVLNGTDVTDLITTATITKDGDQVVTMTADGAPFVTLDALDFSEPVEFVLTVADAGLGITYQVTYTATVVVLE